MKEKEILSQSEIDMLLNALATGELRADEVGKERTRLGAKNYDFRRPNKFSKDQLRTLFLIHDNFARIVSNYLSAYLRSSIQMRIASVDQLTYEDFVNSIPSPTLMTFFSAQPLKGTAVMETNLGFIYPIIDLLFGGPGEVPVKLRELTEIELNVLRKLNGKILDNLANAWAELFEFTPSIEALETNPRFNQIISPNETVAIISFSTVAGKHEGMLNLCLPYITLEAVISKLTARYWLANQEKEQGEVLQKGIQHLLNHVPVDMTVTCGQAHVTIREFLQLNIGDVIRLDSIVGRDMGLYVEDKLKFKVQPGVTGRKFAVQVTALANEGNEL
ncbi:MAG: flagellar motor switch protein FliM [Bacillota bacterium]